MKKTFEVRESVRIEREPNSQPVSQSDGRPPKPEVDLEAIVGGLGLILIIGVISLLGWFLSR